ncbi:hypothetical protein ACVRY7_03090 [Streptococcus ictaluri]|uniref:Lipoprotein n=1 Tax=Streptococcus ictaluri 707-05 TaxID=764299 RepID=G5K0P4_9STRE|nr:hypothetical protein [Streptococcus ictaluri]EHI70468.1 putative lipoprotein [Streptococcus ictaluri 707-05]
MKKKTIILLSSLLLLTACSNHPKNTAKTGLDKKDKSEQISKKTSKHKSLHSTTESSSEPSSQTSKTQTSSSVESTPSKANTETSNQEEYETDLFPSAYIANENKKLRDGFYIAPSNNTSIISQYTDMKET